ncbi:MAG: CoA transferase [Chloroflexi bacterium]|nr:CoA transferase [Chloroflexota bacterium]
MKHAARVRLGWFGLASSASPLNIGKESVAFNLKKPFGREALGRLIQSVDVLYQNYRPGIAESLGFWVEDVLQLNPGIVYVYAASYGRTSLPARNHRSCDHRGLLQHDRTNACPFRG